jgi:26S proteasome regulatory subunit T1
MTKEQIDTKKKPEAKDGDDKKPTKDDKPKDEMGRPLSESDIAMLRRYGKGPYADALKKCEDEVKELNQKITSM